MNIIFKGAEKALGEVETSTPVKPKLDEAHPMHALAWYGKKDVRYIETPRPMITDQRDIVLRVTASSICGSDLHMYTNHLPDMHKGDILGHEFMGIVEEVGSEVKKLKKGQRVVVSFAIACGDCDYCKRQEYTACDTTNPSRLMEKMYGHRSSAIYGYSHLTGGVPGGQAEYVRVPFADVNCLIVPEALPDDVALYLSDIIPTSYHGVELGDVKEGDVVAIWGLGPVGLLTARWAQIRKARRVIGIDCVEERLDMARKVLSIEVINFKEQDTVKTINEICPGGVDVAIECVGFEYAKTWTHKIEMALGLETDTADVFTEMFTCVRKFGRVSVIGVYTGYANHFPVGAMMEKDLTIKCGQCPCQKYWDIIVPKLLSGEFDPRFVVTTRGRLSDGPELYKKFQDRVDGVVKVYMEV
jgi:threonine dehydrogenase-like Zn-dependent dehydrogenase